MPVIHNFSIANSTHFSLSLFFCSFMSNAGRERKNETVDSQRNVPVFSQRILPDAEFGLNQSLKKQ